MEKDKARIILHDLFALLSFLVTMREWFERHIPVPDVQASILEFIQSRQKLVVMMIDGIDEIETTEKLDIVSESCQIFGSVQKMDKALVQAKKIADMMKNTTPETFMSTHIN